MLKTSSFVFDPVYVAKPWGGLRLKGAPGIGEAFLISDFKDFATRSQGKTISDLMGSAGENLLGEKILKKYGGRLPVYLKELDSVSNLSIQVHPDNKFARILENEDFGKNEFWYILDAKPESRLYIGLKNGVTRETLSQGLIQNRDISQLLNSIPVGHGDAFYIPAGLVHAIGKDIHLLEPQQNSNRTYRLWDWGKIDKNGNPRPLHIEKALMVINFDPAFNTTFSKKIFPEKGVLIDSQFFTVNFHTLTGGTLSPHPVKAYRIVTLISGEIQLKFENFEETTLRPSRACLVPAFVKKWVIKATRMAEFLVICPK